ncbi:signal recognition particle, SRP19 subunit [Gorgonomyces haynaldii]|nr:signal recognition particle, SRP19 subunit [Gorgonomyces haynaldii]
MDIDNMDFDQPQTQEIMVYPVYIDKTKSFRQGRKLNQELCVEEPSIVYMAEAAKRLGYGVQFEPQKRHPRDPLVFGRLKIVKAGKSKKQVMKEIAFAYPTMVLELSDPKVKEMAEHSRSQIPLDMSLLSIQEAPKKKKK